MTSNKFIVYGQITLYILIALILFTFAILSGIAQAWAAATLLSIFGIGSLFTATQIQLNLNDRNKS
jgi:hypothetical protein